MSDVPYFNYHAAAAALGLDLTFPDRGEDQTAYHANLRLAAPYAVKPTETFEDEVALDPITLAPRTLRGVQDRSEGGYRILLPLPFYEIIDRGVPSVVIAGSAVTDVGVRDYGRSLWRTSGEPWPDGMPVEITGWFGYGSFEPRGTIIAGYSEVATFFRDTNDAFGVEGDVIRVDDELMRIDYFGHTHSVSRYSPNQKDKYLTRGFAGSTPARHSYGAAVRRLVIPETIRSTAALIAKRQARIEASPAAGAYTSADGQPPQLTLTYALRRTFARYRGSRTVVI